MEVPPAAGGSDTATCCQAPVAVTTTVRNFTTVEPRYSRSLRVIVRPAGAFTQADAA